MTQGESGSQFIAKRVYIRDFSDDDADDHSMMMITMMLKFSSWFLNHFLITREWKSGNNT